MSRTKWYLMSMWLHRLCVFGFEQAWSPPDSQRLEDEGRVEESFNPSQETKIRHFFGKLMSFAYPLLQLETMHFLLLQESIKKHYIKDFKKDTHLCTAYPWHPLPNQRQKAKLIWGSSYAWRRDESLRYNLSWMRVFLSTVSNYLSWMQKDNTKELGNNLRVIQLSNCK